MRLRKILVAVLFAGAFLQMTATVRAGAGRFDLAVQQQTLLDDLRVICSGHTGVGKLPASELPASPVPACMDGHCQLCSGVGGFVLSDAAGLRGVAALDLVPIDQPRRSGPVTADPRVLPPVRGPPSIG